MAYIGRTPAYGYFEKDIHTGDGIVSQFNLTYPVASPNQLLVSLDGIIQEPDYSYNVTMVSGQAKINFSEAPDIGARIFIVYVGRQLLTAGSNAPSSYLDEFDGDNSTTAFTLTRTPATTDAANFIVYVDNVYQREGSSYAYTVSGETITFTSPPPTGTNNIQVYQLSLSNEVNTVSDGSVSEAKLANGSVTSAKIADDAVTISQVDSSSVTLGFRNKIIGGNFSTNPWQRGTSFTSAAGFTADRFSYDQGASAIVNIAKTADAPTIAESGIFTQHCLQLEVTTPDTTIGSADYSTVSQRIEGYNISDMGFGQPGTRYFTLSFWHKHTKSGTYCVSIQNAAGNRSYIAEYNQSLSDTWEKAELTIPVDTSGTWLYDNGIGLHLWFVLLSGSNYQTTAGSWQAGNYLGTSNQVNALDNLDDNGDPITNHFRIALVQLEAGQTATAFENRSVGQELALCQRYYHQTDLAYLQRYDASAYADTTYRVYTTPSLPQTLRTTPTVSQSGLTVDGVAVTSVSGVDGIQRMSFRFNHGGSRTANESYQVYASTIGYVKFDAEL